MNVSRPTTLASVLQRLWRASLPGGPLLSLDEMAEALPGDVDASRTWVEENIEPALNIGAVAAYRWADVVATSRPATGQTVHQAIPQGQAWWTHEETYRHLRVDPRTLATAMRGTPDHIDAPWIDIGSGRKHNYRWEASEVDRWWREVHQWRASKNEARATGSGGGTRTASRGHGSVQTTGRQKRSKGRSKGVEHSESAGSLIAHLRSLDSEKS